MSLNDSMWYRLDHSPVTRTEVKMMFELYSGLRFFALIILTSLSTFNINI